MRIATKSYLHCSHDKQNSQKNFPITTEVFYNSFLLLPQKTTHCWNVVITAWFVNFMNFCFILMMHDDKVFNCSSFRNLTIKGSFTRKIFKVKVNKGLLNTEGEKLLLNFNVVVIWLILNKTKTN